MAVAHSNQSFPPPIAFSASLTRLQASSSSSLFLVLLPFAMSWFRKDKNQIPAVQSEDAKRQELLGSRGGNSTSPRPPSNFSRSSSATYVASRDGDPYNTPSSVPPPPRNYGDRYARQDAVGDIYSRGQSNIDRDRNELFAGHDPKKAGSGRFFDDGPQNRPGRRGTPPPGEENDEDVEGIKQDMRFLKQDSVNSTRNALRLAREAEETARNTVNKLGSQSGAFRVSHEYQGAVMLTPGGVAGQRNSRTPSATWTFLRVTRSKRRTRRTS